MTRQECYTAQLLPPEGATPVEGTLSDPCACPDGWLLCAGRCISWRTTSASFSSAQSGCQQMGAHLATARSEAEHQCTLGSKYGWVGATDEATEGVYVGQHA
ncbi:Type-2 ice-structuring protein [Amphibalanus amphitrite]|uniref:Type-2 ice-structuring protein n=1 Tax=Amphibalanus amphitrite TaxID=1232801 RepID=A0A6A4VD82_AMPAM|nr:Type-2 ice-structuring protein [Amphibalanus amphitrite]